MSKKVSPTVVGYDYWGPDLVRNFRQLRDSNLVAVRDLEETNLKKAKASFILKLKPQGGYWEIVNDPEVKAVLIATTDSTHDKLAKESLFHNKDVFVEKPLVPKAKEGRNW